MLCLFLDAFKPSYLRHTSYLKSLKKESLWGELETVLGYTGITASFLTGLWPEKHGVFDVFRKRERPGTGINLKLYVNMKRLLSDNRYFFTPLRVPGRVAGHFETSVKRAWPQRGVLRQKTLFDILEENRKGFASIDWPNHYTNRRGGIFISNSTGTIVKKTRDSRADFTYSHFMEMENAHKWGTNSGETRDAVKRLDEAIETLDREDIMFFSDHGMHDIKREEDMMGLLSGLGLRFGRDCIYFIGSTMARFWFNNDKARDKVNALLGDLKWGRIIDPRDFHLPGMCDTLFLADLGVVMQPNFFMGDSRYRAMHGWDPGEREQKAFYMIRNLEGRRNARMIDMLPTILKLLGIPQIKCDGKPLNPSANAP
jgi:hypothetical protein